MIRKVVLLLGSFLVVLMALLVYEAVVPSTDPDTSAPYEDVSDEPSNKMFTYESRDKNGRLQHRLEIPKWSKNTDGRSYELVRPSLVLYSRDGQRVFISADEGTMFAENLEGKIRKLNLRQNVRIFLDDYRPAEHDIRDRRPPLPMGGIANVVGFLERYPEDIFRIYADDLDFDNEKCSLATDGPVTVLSDDTDIYGDGLMMVWNEAPQELMELRLERGQRMVIYNMAKEGQLLTLPGSEAAEGKVALSRATAATPGTAPAAASAPVPPAPRPDAEPKRRNVFVATFAGDEEDVRVYSGKRSMHGAKYLKIQLEFEGSMRTRSRRRRSAKSEPAPAAPPPRSARSATAPATRKRPPVESAATRPAATRPTGSRPARPPVTVLWDGPLVLVPLAKRVEKPSTRRYKIEVAGDKVVLRDGESTATCRKFLYHHEHQEGWLIGRAGAPVRLDLGDGQIVVCERIKFNREIAQANLIGAGYMTRTRLPKIPDAEAREQLAELRELTGIEDPIELARLAEELRRPVGRPTASNAGEDRIDWGHSVLAEFAQTERRRDDGTVRMRQYIKQATFVQDVKLTQSKTRDFVECDRLEVWMVRGRTGKPYPAKAVARGRAGRTAHARQRGSDIRARELTVEFLEREPDPGPGSERRSDLGGRSKPVMLLASGDVHVETSPPEPRASRDKDPSGPSKIVTATADALTCDLEKDTAILHGDPARIIQEPAGQPGGDKGGAGEELVGNEIRLEQADQKAEVIGQGRLKFMADKDLSGRRLPERRAVTIDWHEGMTYRPAAAAPATRPAAGGPGPARVAVFTGEVVLVSGGDRMTCGKMTVDLKPPAPKAPATRPADIETERRRRGTVNMADYSATRMSKVTGEANVVLTSVRRDKEDYLLRRMKLKGDKLEYFADRRRILMPGAGTLLNEDYRPEQEGGPPRDPSQSLFEWDKSMLLVQNEGASDAKERSATLRGNVTMMHHSGRRTRRPGNLKVRPLGPETPSGRTTLLYCEQMYAQFGEAADKKARGKSPATREAKAVPPAGPAIGELRLFNAVGADPVEGQAEVFVDLQDGGRHIVGKRLIYDRKSQVATVWGNLPEAPGARAKKERDGLFELEGPDGVKSWSSPKITIQFQGRQVTRVQAEGGGGGD